MIANGNKLADGITNSNWARLLCDPRLKHVSQHTIDGHIAAGLEALSQGDDVDITNLRNLLRIQLAIEEAVGDAEKIRQHHSIIVATHQEIGFKQHTLNLRKISEETLGEVRSILSGLT